MKGPRFESGRAPTMRAPQGALAVATGALILEFTA
jgi:hypothetical protein